MSYSTKAAVKSLGIIQVAPAPLISALGSNLQGVQRQSKQNESRVNKLINLTTKRTKIRSITMTDIQADPTDTRTLRPKRKPLQRKGT